MHDNWKIVPVVEVDTTFPLGLPLLLPQTGTAGKRLPHMTGDITSMTEAAMAQYFKWSITVRTLEWIKTWRCNRWTDVQHVFNTYADDANLESISVVRIREISEEYCP